MMNHLRIIPVLLGLTVAAAAPLAAQEPAPAEELVDRVVAVVGDSVVLQSDIDVQVLRMAASGRPIPRNDPVAMKRLRRQILDSMIDELLLVQAASRDSITASEGDVDAMVERDLAQRRQAFGSEEAFNRALAQQGMTLAEYRETLAREYRRSQLVQRYMAMMQRQRTPPPVTEEEIREFFEERRAQLGERPATITFEQVVVAPEPTDSAYDAAMALAEDILERLENGEEFERLARRYSDDPGSKQQGGDLGWFRPSQMVPEFADAVRRLRPGQTSGIVESPFGLHIIRLERIKGAERKARHILIQPEITKADRERARVRAEEVVAKARAGATMDELVETYGDPSEQRRVGPFPVDQLPEPYAAELRGAEAGTVVGPFPLSGSGGADKWAVVKVTDVNRSGEYTLDDVRAQIRQQIQRQKMIDELVEELRRSTYVDIRL